MNPGLEKQLEILRENLQRIQEERNALKEEIRYYQLENRELKASLNRSSEGGKNFPKPAEKRNIATEKESYTGKVATIVQQIDVCVEEIDRCIARLDGS